MNLHFCVPPFSEHPPSCTEGIIYSLLQRCFKPNTYQQAFAYFVGLLYHCLIQWGWDRTTISKLILQATAQAKNESTSPPTIITSNADVMSSHTLNSTKTESPERRSGRCLNPIQRKFVRKNLTKREWYWPSPGQRILETSSLVPSYTKPLTRVHLIFWGSSGKDWILTNYPKKLHSMSSRPSDASLLDMEWSFFKKN